MPLKLTEKKALACSTGFVDYNNLMGYFPFSAANNLVSTGGYKFHQSTWCGYILIRNEALNHATKAHRTQKTPRQSV